jgi:hypothetical protein
MGKGGNNVAKHSKLPPSKRKPQGDYSKKVIENVAFWKKHKLNYTAGSKSKSKACTTDTKPQDMTEESYVSLRYLDQLPFEHYLTMSQGQAKKLLLDKQVLAHKKETFLCWECGFPMTGDDPVLLQCCLREATTAAKSAIGIHALVKLCSFEGTDRLQGVCLHLFRHGRQAAAR